MLILFDYDGVIVDSFKTIHEVYLEICAELGLSCPTDIEEFRHLYGKHHLVGYQRLGIVDDLVAEADRIFAREIVKKDPPVYSLLKETLAALAQKHTLVLVSATVKEEILQKTERHGLARFFTRIISTPEFSWTKEEAFARVMHDLGFSAHETIAIGDRSGDYDAAQSAGISRILITRYGWGFDEGRVPEAIIVEHPEDLLAAVERVSR